MLSKEEISKIHGILHHLNPTAKVYETIRSQIPLKSIINTYLFNFQEAERNAGWLKEIRGEHIPESEEYGITSFVYREKLPFHPNRLYELFFSSESKIFLIQKKIEKFGKESLNEEEKTLFKNESKVFVSR